jgi:hypothetical protein
VSIENPSILWRRLDVDGHDACRVLRIGEGWRLEGVAAFAHEGGPCALAYAVDCDSGWRARAARVTGWRAEGSIDLQILRSETGEWRMNGVVQPAARDLVDIDLGFTPATNLIAIRRLDLAIGHGSPAPAAYLAFPDLRLDRLDQTYQRLDARRYRYSAPAYGYDEALTVSAEGFVTAYPSLWEAVS